MKILHVTAAVAPRYGGPSAAIWPMVSELHQAGMTVELVTTDADGPHRQLKNSDLPKVPFPLHVLPGPRESHVELAAWMNANAKQIGRAHV